MLVKSMCWWCGGNKNHLTSTWKRPLHWGRVVLIYFLWDYHLRMSLKTTIWETTTRIFLPRRINWPLLIRHTFLNVRVRFADS